MISDSQGLKNGFAKVIKTYASTLNSFSCLIFTRNPTHGPRARYRLLTSVFKTHVHQTRHRLSTYSRHVKIVAVLFWQILRISVGDKDGVRLDFNPGGVRRSLTYKEREKNTFKTLRKRVGEV